MKGKLMETNPISLNPFSLMMEPEAVLAAMNRSTSLRALRRRRLHPLDKPLIPYAKGVVIPEDDFEDEEETKH
jgi:hypothetical protein